MVETSWAWREVGGHTYKDLYCCTEKCSPIRLQYFCIHDSNIDIHNQTCGLLLMLTEQYCITQQYKSYISVSPGHPRGGTTRSHDQPKGLWISLTCAWISFKTVYFDSGFGLACIFQEIHLMFLRSGWFIGLILMWNSFSTSFNHHLDIEIRPARWKPPTCTYVRTCE